MVKVYEIIKSFFKSVKYVSACSRIFFSSFKIVFFSAAKTMFFFYKICFCISIKITVYLANIDSPVESPYLQMLY